MKLQPGDILAVHSKTLLGKFIRMITKSWCNHVAIYLDENTVLEARPGGVKTIKLTKSPFRVYRLQVSKEKINQFIHYALLKRGKGYDYGEILSLLIFFLCKWDLKAQNSHKTICSELIYEAAQEAGLPIPPVSKSKIIPRNFESWEIAKRMED